MNRLLRGLKKPGSVFSRTIPSLLFKAFMLDPSYHRRRVARQMQDPVYRAAYEQAAQEIRTANHQAMMTDPETAALWAQTQGLIADGDIEGLASAMRRDAEGLAEELAARAQQSELLDESEI
jgi:hypothetical protein